MSATPRTDAETLGNIKVEIEFARTLERENARLREELAEAKRERDKHFAASKAQNADITALQTELAEVKRESLKLSALVVERDYQITLANKGYDYEGAVEDSRHYKEVAAALREELAEAKSHTKKMSKADVLLRKARLCIDPFRDPDVAEEIDAYLARSQA